MDVQNHLRHVLYGYKVIDFTQALAGPTCTRLMAEMGADVIKIELTPNGDLSRALNVVKEGRSAYYVQQNRGKKSVCIDVKNPAGLAVIKELLPKMDVLVENFAPRVIGRLGLSYDVVKSINPRIIMCSISALGQSGPLSDAPGFDFIAQAYAAVTHMIGDPDSAPSMPMLGLGDVSTGAHAMGAIACALLYRERTGQGQHLDISILDAYFHCHEMNVQIYSLSKGATKPIRSGAQHPQVCPTGIFKGKTGYMVIMAFQDHSWAALCRVMGQAELAQDAKFIDNTARLAHQKEVIALIERWLASTPSDEAAIEELRKARIPVAPILSIEQAVNHPHHRGRGTVRKISDRVIGEFDVPGFPLKFSAFPETLDLQASFLGEDNADVLKNYLGYDSGRIAALEKEGVIKSERR